MVHDVFCAERRDGEHSCVRMRMRVRIAHTVTLTPPRAQESSAPRSHRSESLFSEQTHPFGCCCAGCRFSPTVSMWFQIFLSRHEQFDKWLKQARMQHYEE